MDEKYNLGKMVFYCDESCHLKGDNSRFMALASVYCRKDRAKAIAKEIKHIKLRYKISPQTELKWNKVSSATLDMYKEIFNYIKSNGKLKIRIVVADKYIQKDQSEWYNKMYYTLIEYPLQSILWNFKLDKIEILTDKKDSNSYKDMGVVSKYLSRHFKKSYNVQVESKVCESYDVLLIQIADLLAGAATYKNRSLNTSPSKTMLIEFIEKTFKINLSKTTKSFYGKISDYNIYMLKQEKKDELF